MAFKNWSAGDVLTAADVNDYLMEQAVIVCTSGTRPSSPNEGMHIYETDTNLQRVYDGSGWVTLTSPSAFTSYSPAWSASTVNPTIGNGTLSGAYTVRGKLAIAYISTTFGSTTNAGSGQYSWSVPFTFAAGSRCYGSAIMRDNSGAVHSTAGVTDGTTTTISLRYDGGNIASNAGPFTWATSDFIHIVVVAETT